MKSGWIGKITNSPEETVMLGHQFSKFLEKGIQLF